MDHECVAEAIRAGAHNIAKVRDAAKTLELFRSSVKTGSKRRFANRNRFKIMENLSPKIM